MADECCNCGQVTGHGGICSSSTSAAMYACYGVWVLSKRHPHSSFHAGPPCCQPTTLLPHRPNQPCTHTYVPPANAPHPLSPPPLLQQTHTCTTQVSADRLLDKELLSPGGGMGRAIPLHTKGEVGAPLNARGHAAHDDHDHQGSTTASSSTTTGSTTTSSTVSSSQKEGAKQREEADAQVAASRRRSAAKKR